MTARALPRSRLDNLIPSLVDAQALVALVPATGDLQWAAAAAWDVARAAARQGQRRVALVDLWLEEPKLHQVVGLAPTEGIVDAFEYGVSLTKAAHEIDHVFFIASGAYTTHVGDLFGNPRWKKLHGGFRVEGALLLLYLSAGGLARLSSTPDGLIVLSPDGFEPESSIGLGITAAVERGTPLPGVVRERWAPAAPTLPDPLPRQVRRSRPTPLPQPIPDSPQHSPRSRRRARPLIVAATLAAGAAGSWALLAISGEQWSRRLPVPPAAPAPPAVRPRAVIAEADPVPWTVQLAAYGRLENALAVADRVLAEGVPAFVTPIALQGPDGSAVWYRVLAGAYATRDSAAAARAALWARGLAPRGQGDVLSAPYSLSFTGLPPDSLRARGIPAVRWGGGGDSAVLVGAFETPEQASLTEAQLERAGIQATLVTRMGTRP